MKIVIAPDKFKGTLSSEQAAEAIAEGISAAFTAKGTTTRISFGSAAKTPDEPAYNTDCHITLSPMADGGEGSIGLITGKSGKYIKVEAVDALMRPIETMYGWTTIGGRRTAIVESASTVGLFRLSDMERDPLKTTSYGLGVMLREAVSSGYEDIAVTVGGTATNDCGTGMLAALGCLFYDDRGNVIEFPTGADLIRITSLDTRHLMKLSTNRNLNVLCDVDNPLLGESGAAAVFSPQKGADAKTVTLLEKGAENLSGIVNAITGTDHSATPGTGAGGGIAWALKALCGAEIVSGSEFIGSATGFENSMDGADLVITGEGSFDTQSLHGKAAGYVAAKAKEHGIPVIVLCGTRDRDIPKELLQKAGITLIAALTDRVSSEKAMENARCELTKLSFDIFSGPQPY